MRKIYWSMVLSSEDVNECIESLYRIVKDIVTTNTPLTTRRPTQYPTWFSKPLLGLLKKRNKFHKRYKKYDNPRDVFSCIRKRCKLMIDKCFINFLEAPEELLTERLKCDIQKTAADYDRFPLSYAKKAIRVASLDEWRQRYTEGGTAEITKCFFPRVEEAYRILSRFVMTPLLAQTLTGHGGFAQYLNRFRLNDSPYCACAPDKIQDVLHVLEECPIFGRERAETEAGAGVVVEAWFSGSP
ncbi:hypothetical protein EVAR_79338_1 [Eumeta japonica]|uniref:115 kDa protein in type-1 retrotransposable element R1DM n=1 Tax=Eumeta variegata TaxID=151549 RepID=A0A4C1TFT3_EUMVA|nr:hypothetical protein EVAR_79338_1 [Eumeta japonica]